MSDSNILTEQLSKRILLFDGGMGTMIQDFNLTAEDFGGPELEGCNENLVLTRPDVIKAIHEEYLRAGADIIETNTFGATSIVLEEYGLQHKAYEMNVAAAKIAREAVSNFPGTFVGGSLGPTTKSIVVTQDISYDAMKASYLEQARGLIEGGIDIAIIETVHDSLNVKAALHAVNEAAQGAGVELPVFISSSMALAGRMLAGQDIEGFFATFSSIHVHAIGMNCAVGPKDLHEPINVLSDLTDLPTFMYPNAGLPNEHGEYDLGPKEFADTLEEYARAGLLNLVGGCCGTGPDHIRELKSRLEGIPPRPLVSKERPLTVSGVQSVTPNEKMRIMLVGERANVQGSRRFKELIRNQQFEEALEVVKDQVQGGSQILDICLEDTEYNEVEAINKFYPKLAQATKLPIMIDSTDPVAVETALKQTQGKSIINSINLESGFEKLGVLVGLMKKYGAAAVVGLIDEIDGMALTYDKKLEVADRLYHILVDDHGIPPEDIIFDLLVFTVDSGTDETLRGTSQATIKAISEIKRRYPRVSTILGVSNVSFGLPPAGREVLNSVFFYHAVQAGLDLAIVNPNLIIRYASIPDEELVLAERVLETQSIEALTEFSNYYRDSSRREINVIEDLPPKEAIHKSIVFGAKAGVIDNLDALLQEFTPLEIINGVIMDGMKEVGVLFEQAKMIVTEVLQSAEVVKLAISHLEPLIITEETVSKKTVMLATVKGDVHDIGKNLVRIILESNGYAVIDLGIRVDSQELINKIRELNPDAVGLSGLLVKSSRYMVTVVEHLKSENIGLPLLLGGAALTPKFVENDVIPARGGTGDVFYAKDAMAGLAIVNSIFEGEN
ncbi:MAG: homocysteine S-methyltransferase family protein [Candidatus Kariarchaeaceae archaeon]|jgi:5-methyltetrahydrofolate--homocysteine methyltransferase